LGNIYISDTYNERIRKIDSTGKITTFAGVGQSGYQGDGGPAFQAYITVPQGLRFDPSGNLVFADSNNNAIRSINPQGVITTIAGTGTAGYNGDGISATQAQLNLPTDVAFDSAGNLYIADAKNNRIRRVGSNKTITTVAGTGIAGFSGDGLATGVELFFPIGINFDLNGNLLIADTNNNRIRLLTPSGQLRTIVGDGLERYNGDGSLATAASLANPEGVVVDGAGNIYIADANNNRIREVLAGTVTYQAAPTSLMFSGVAGGSAPGVQTINLSSAISGLAFTASSNAPWLSVGPAIAPAEGWSGATEWSGRSASDRIH
jgi:sugar lactone lactonase YvrE